MTDNVLRMSRDIAAAASSLSDQEARYLVDAYYIMQEDRKRACNQDRAVKQSADDENAVSENSVIAWLAEQSTTLEKQIARALDKYTQAHAMGSWMREVVGIGPIISAGMLAPKVPKDDRASTGNGTPVRTPATPTSVINQ